MAHKKSVHKWHGGNAKILCTLCDPPKECSTYNVRAKHFLVVHNLTDYQYR